MLTNHRLACTHVEPRLKQRTHEARCMSRKKPGRPRKEGARYANGRLKQTSTPPAELQRTLHAAREIARDQRWGSVLGYLHLDKRLDGLGVARGTARAQAGHQYAALVGQVAALMGVPKRRAASPSYVRAYRAVEEAEADVESLQPRGDRSDDEIADIRRRLGLIRAKVEALDPGPGRIPRALRILDAVTVDEYMPAHEEMSILIAALDVLALHYGYIVEERKRA